MSPNDADNRPESKGQQKQDKRALLDKAIAHLDPVIQRRVRQYVQAHRKDNEP